MKNLLYLNRYRTPNPFTGKMGDEHNGAFQLRIEGSTLRLTAVAAEDSGWDHVSIFTSERCPHFKELEQIKQMFFQDPKLAVPMCFFLDEYIDMHPNYLHLWGPNLDYLAAKWLT